MVKTKYSIARIKEHIALTTNSLNLGRISILKRVSSSRAALKINKKLRSFLPWLLTAEDGENAFHWIAISILWSVVFGLLAVLHWVVTRANIRDLLELYSVMTTVVGGVWIGAGVIYEKPTNQNLNLKELQAHVTNTFAYTSRHCAVGVTLLVVGYCLFLMSKIERFDTNPPTKPIHLHSLPASTFEQSPKSKK